MSKSAEIKKQVEYYLSDKNLVNDKFFNEKLTEHADVIDTIIINELYRDG